MRIGLFPRFAGAAADDHTQHPHGHPHWPLGSMTRTLATRVE